jgi:hypothetical protein
MPAEASQETKEERGLARSRLSEEDGESVAFLDGIAELIERDLVGLSVIVGGVVGKLEGFVTETIVMKVHGTRLMKR